MRTVAIAGVGLIGGSFGLALRRAGFDGPILGVSSPGAIREALALGAIDKGVPLEEAAARADLIYLSQTIERILETIRSLGPLVRPGCLVTDAGSTKLRIVEEARRSLPPGAFLGGHPMAGKETRGAATAEASLFEGRTYVLTPAGETPATLEFRTWLDRIGAIPVVMEAAAHDRVVALTSHLPQLASTALGALLAGRLDEADRRIAGPGLKDMTRLALSSYDIWRDILATNPAPIAAALDAYIEELRRLRAGLEAPSMRESFDQAAALALSLRRQ
ncbi:MAG: prephenate dehydrogenase/arogenate dehydrogenase family protein [Acidobacteria bacterium]|nr:prephenate dehydrogenase/arogenate dehydrogenase family protein [Acidobacteriota bacterium]